jgi:predicted nucleic acid-binding protein
MPVKVIDASALAAILFNEPDSGRVVSRIAGDALVAPQLISFEVASACFKKIRAHPSQSKMLVAAFRLMDRLDIDMTFVDLADVIALAQDTGLTVYDASYLWLARLLKCELVTLDKRLALASKR